VSAPIEHDVRFNEKQGTWSVIQVEQVIADKFLSREDAVKWVEEYERVEEASLDSIPVNTPMCDKCGNMFLECKCDQIHSVTK
jgi:hypothetical protein